MNVHPAALCVVAVGDVWTQKGLSSNNYWFLHTSAYYNQSSLNLSCRCYCVPGSCGPDCNLEDPCMGQNVCQNGGVCSENCGAEASFFCNCTEGFTGSDCSEVVSRFYLFSNLAGAFNIEIIMS